MIEDVLSAIIPLVILLFMATWSDHFGRRLLILMSLWGKVLDMVTYIVVSESPRCPVPVLMVGHLIRCLGGDSIVFSNAVYSFIADNTQGTDRTYRMSIMTAFWFLG